MCGDSDRVVDLFVRRTGWSPTIADLRDGSIEFGGIVLACRGKLDAASAVWSVVRSVARLSLDSSLFWTTLSMAYLPEPARQRRS